MSERIGIMPPHKYYKCLKCNNPVSDIEIENKRCPLCFHIKLIHKGCGGEVVEDKIFTRIY